MQSRIRQIFSESARIQEEFLRENGETLELVIGALADTIVRGNKILIFGNGGSAADAQHLAAEFVNRYLLERPPLPAIALTTDTSVLTAISNDYSFEDVFVKQIEALAKEGDAVVGISTSGTSINVVKGLESADAKGLLTVGLGGPPQSPVKTCCRHYLHVRDCATPRAQEVHHIVGHVIVEMIDEKLFGQASL